MNVVLGQTLVLLGFEPRTGSQGHRSPTELLVHLNSTHSNVYMFYFHPKFPFLNLHKKTKIHFDSEETDLKICFDIKWLERAQRPGDDKTSSYDKKQAVLRFLCSLEKTKFCNLDMTKSRCQKSS